MGSFANLYKKIFPKVKPEILIAVAIVIMIGIVFASTFTGAKKTKNTDNQQVSSINISESSTATVESKLSTVLAQIKGAGKVQVMVTYDTGTETVPVMSTDREVITSENSGTSQNSKSETVHEKSSPVTVESNGESTAMVLTEKNPVVRGVIVISEGAGQPSVKLMLLEAVQTVLNITPDKVDVFEMN